MLKNYFLKHLVILILVSILLTAFFTFPFIFKLTTFYPLAGDYPANGWTYWYVLRSFSNINNFNITNFYNSPQFYPFGYTLTQLDFQLFTSLFIFGPTFQITKNLILGVNLTVFFSFAATFLSTYFCLVYFVKNKTASILGSIVFTFCPPLMAHFISGHIEYLTRFFIPPLLTISVIFFQKPDFKIGLLLSLLFILNLITSLQMTTFSSIFVLIIFVVNLYQKIKAKDFLNWAVKMVSPGTALLVSVSILILFYLPYFSSAPKREVELLTIYSPKIYDFFMGLPENIIFGNFYKSLDQFRLLPIPNYGINYAERTLFPGFWAILAVFMFIAGKIKNIPSSLKLIIFSSILASYVLALGPIYSFGKTSIAMPYYYLYKILPGIDLIRTPGRIYLVGLFFIALISAYLFRQILESSKGPIKIILTIAVVLSLLFEYKNRFEFPSCNIQTSNYDLSGKKVVFLPFAEIGNDAYESKYLTLMVQNNFLMVNGNTGTSPVGFEEARENLQNLDFDKKWFDELKKLDVRYVIIDMDKLKDFPNIQKGVELKRKNITNIMVYEDPNWIILDISLLNEKI